MGAKRSIADRGRIEEAFQKSTSIDRSKRNTIAIIITRRSSKDDKVVDTKSFLIRWKHSVNGNVIRHFFCRLATSTRGGFEMRSSTVL
jgi:hypothetical protein